MYINDRHDDGCHSSHLHTSATSPSSPTIMGPCNFIEDIHHTRDLAGWLPDTLFADLHYLLFRFALVPIFLRILKFTPLENLQPELRCLCSKTASRRAAPGPSPDRILSLLKERYAILPVRTPRWHLTPQSSLGVTSQTLRSWSSSYIVPSLRCRLGKTTSVAYPHQHTTHLPM